MSSFPSMAEGSLPDLLRHWPELGNVTHGFMQQVMRGPSPLSEGKRELLAAFVSDLNDCQYCQRSHAKAAELFGEDSGVLNALALSVEAAPIEDCWKPLFHLAQELTRRPAQLGPTDIEAALDCGWDETAVFHAITVCAACNAENRIVAAAGIEVDGPAPGIDPEENRDRQQTSSQPLPLPYDT